MGERRWSDVWLSYLLSYMHCVPRPHTHCTLLVFRRQVHLGAVWHEHCACDEVEMRADVLVYDAVTHAEASEALPRDDVCEKRRLGRMNAEMDRVDMLYLLRSALLRTKQLIHEELVHK